MGLPDTEQVIWWTRSLDNLAQIFSTDILPFSKTWDFWFNCKQEGEKNLHLEEFVQIQQTVSADISELLPPTDKPCENSTPNL